jgi:hypothetical protein
VRRKLAILLLLVLPSLLAAQTKVRLQFESTSPRFIWAAETFPTGVPKDAISTESPALDLTVKSSLATIYVLDAKSGNLAVKPSKEAGSTYTFTSADFSRLGTVRVRLQHDFKPVQVASITLSDGKRTQPMIIDPSSKGEADVFGFAPGTLNAELSYKASDGMHTMRTSLDVPLQHGVAEPQWIIQIPEDVATGPREKSATPAPDNPAPDITNRSPNTASGDPAATAGSSGTDAAPNAAQTPPKADKPNPLGKIFTMIVVIGLVGLAVFFGYSWLQKNPGKAQTALQHIGAPVPDPTPPPGPVGTPVSMPDAPEPPQKIILSGADPITPMSSFAAAPAPMGMSGQLRLLRSNGQSIALPEGVSVVGRDTGLEISLAGESTVSRRHAELHRNGTSLSVKDLGSTNGTFLNGVQLSGEVPLVAGDTVQFGSVSFRVEG